MLKEGYFGIDDYVKFGRLINCATKNGAVNFIYSPKKGKLVIVVRTDDIERVKGCIRDEYKVEEIIVRGGTSWIKVVV